MIILAVIVTIIVGWVAGSLGYSMNFPELGPILSVAVMGGFILAAIRKSGRRDEASREAGAPASPSADPESRSAAPARQDTDK